MRRNYFSSKVNPIIIHLLTFSSVLSDADTVKQEETTVNEKVRD